MIRWPVFLQGGAAPQPEAPQKDEKANPGKGAKPPSNPNNKNQKPQAASGAKPGNNPKPGAANPPQKKPDYGSPLTIISRAAMRELARRYGWLDIGVDQIRFTESGSGYEALWMPYRQRPDGSYEAVGTPVKIVWTQDPSGEWRMTYSFTTMQEGKPLDHTGGGYIHGIRRQPDGRVAYVSGGRPVTVEDLRKQGLKPEDYLLERVRNYLSGFSYESKPRDSQQESPAGAQNPQLFTRPQGESGAQPGAGQTPAGEGGASPQNPQTPSQTPPQADTREKGSMWDEMVRQMVQMMPMLIMMRMMMGGNAGGGRSDGFPARYVIL